MLAVLFILVATAWGSNLSYAQERGAASPFLPRDHWAIAALERLQGAGLLAESVDPGGSTITRVEVFRGFEHASAAAEKSAPQWTGLIQSYRERLAEEFSRSLERASATGGMASELALVGGLEARRNGVLPRHHLGEGSGFGTKALRNLTQPTGAVEIGLLLPQARFASAAAHGVLQLPADRVYASEAYGVVFLGNLGVWGGRRAIRLGSADGGSVVLNSRVPFEGGGLFLANGARLPGFLRHVGAIRFETTFARLDHSGEVEASWFLGLRASLTPHPRFRIGVNRAAFFGGEHTLVPPMTFGRVARALAGLTVDELDHENFESQVGSFDLWFAPALGSLPLVIYGEWGVEDLSEQLRMPALVGGLEVPGFPGAPWLSLGFEHTSFAEADAGRRQWYDHRVFGTWTDEGRLLGHELGGAGNELRVFAGADLLEARLRMEARGFGRDRKPGNLYAPEREGSSTGVGWTVRWRVIPSVDLETSGELESGTGWGEGGAFLGAHVTL